MALMQAHGTLVLSKTAPLATTAADGTFVLTLHGYDRQATHKVESWRVIFCGTPAKDFWQQCKAHLVPGRAVTLQAHRLRATGSGRFGGAEFEAHATTMALAPAAHAQSGGVAL